MRDKNSIIKEMARASYQICEDAYNSSTSSNTFEQDYHTKVAEALYTIFENQVIPQLTGKFLIRKKGNVVAHHWTGTDTYCRMASTGGLNKKKYEVHTTDKGRKICTMCKNVKDK